MPWRPNITPQMPVVCMNMGALWIVTPLRMLNSGES